MWPIFGHYLSQIVSKIAKFERISNFYDLKHGNTITDPVSAPSYPNCGRYCKKGNFGSNMTHI